MRKEGSYGKKRENYPRPLLSPQGESGRIANPTKTL